MICRMRVGCAPMARRICSFSCNATAWSSSNTLVPAGHSRRNARMSRPAAIKITCFKGSSRVVRCRKSSKKRVRRIIRARLSGGRIAAQAAPSGPARAPAQGSLNKWPSRVLFYERAAAVQRAVDPSRLLEEDFSDIFTSSGERMDAHSDHKPPLFLPWSLQAEAAGWLPGYFLPPVVSVWHPGWHK